MIKSAQFSPCRTYRYALWRRWSRGRDYLLIIGLNPSTADESMDDPTIRRCIGFAKAWGYSALCMANLFAFRTSSPRLLKAQDDPSGPENAQTITWLAKRASLRLAAWGRHGSFRNKAAMTCSRFQALDIPLHCLRLNQDGSPEHPLYVPADTPPMPFNPILH